MTERSIQIARRAGHWCAVATIMSGFTLLIWLVWANTSLVAFNAFLAGLAYKQIQENDRRP